MDAAKKLLELSKQVKTLAEIGLVYQKDDFDQDRYHNLRKIATEMMGLLMNQPLEAIEKAERPKSEYITPKVDVRAVVVNKNGKLLMVKEKTDGKWALPGGWADIGYSPSEIAEKETAEEAGMKVKAMRILAVMDKKCHDHPADIYYVYKIFIACDLIHENLERGFETTDVDYFPVNQLPELSTPRGTEEQLKMVYDLYQHPEKPPYFD